MIFVLAPADEDDDASDDDDAGAHHRRHAGPDRRDQGENGWFSIAG